MLGIVLLVGFLAGVALMAYFPTWNRPKGVQADRACDDCARWHDGPCAGSSR